MIHDTQPKLSHLAAALVILIILRTLILVLHPAGNKTVSAESLVSVRRKKLRGDEPLIKLLQDYPYFYETHLHTSNASLCGRSSGAEMAEACKKAGYTGIFVTDHNWGGNTKINPALPWEEWVDAFGKGYDEARRMGERIGLDVFFAWEAGYEGTEFLVYGMSKEWLCRHPELKCATPQKQYEIICNAGGMVVHAHPFREEPYIKKIRLFPNEVDAVEGMNAAHSHPLPGKHGNPRFDESAIAYAGENALPMTAGSDIHSTQLTGGGMAFRTKLKSAQDFIRAVKDKEDYIITNGEAWYDRFGKKILLT